MAAYAALVSVMNTMHQIQNHASLSISFPKKQFETLAEKVEFFLDFIESYDTHGGSKKVEDLENQITSASHAAEDVIESHVVDQIHVGTSLLFDQQNDIKKIVHWMPRLQKVMVGMDSIKKKIMTIERKGGFEDKQPTYSTTPRSLASGKNIMVGFDDELLQLMEWLTGTQSKLQIIPIVGMGGIGKTTLARNVYENSVIVHYFHVRAWVTISKKYRIRDVLLELLSGLLSQEKSVSNEHKQINEVELGEQLYKSLSGRRYLIVLDDIWSMDAWNEIKLFFPDNNNGSRIVITSRLSNMAIHFGSRCLKVNFLDENRSWKLFCEKTFAEESCPVRLLEIGKEIVGRCRGLPLSIVVIGGLLRKSSKTREYWESVAKDINSILNSTQDKHCVNILSLSYRHLSSHLKPCFLYMGIFPEDDEINVSRLIKLWVSEGFLKPSESQSLEEVAKDYLNDLIERNLILVGKLGSSGNIKTCSVHDLLRDLSIRLAEKEKFIYVTNAVDDLPRKKVHDLPRKVTARLTLKEKFLRVLNSSQGVDGERRIVFHSSQPEYQSSVSQAILALESTSVVRSLICKGHHDLSFKFRLLRVLSMTCYEFPYGDASISHVLTGIFDQVNLQYLACEHIFCSYYELPSSISLLWKVQTLILRGITRVVAPSEIWKLPQLRHVEFDEICLPDPPPGDDIVLGNLQSLRKIVNFKWSENACKRIPNIKKLHTSFDDLSVGSYYSLHNIGSLHALESLNLQIRNLPDRDDLLRELTFPSSLKKLSLTKCQLHWEDLTMIGSLPCLEVLKLNLGSVIGPEWNPVEGEFLSLKYLKIHYSNLMSWNVESSHFPVLECLVLDQLFRLDEIPSGIGEIPTLKVIRLDYCKLSAAISAMEILEEQESLGNDGLQVQVQFWPLMEEESIKEMQEQQSFTSNNFFLRF